MSKKTSSKKSNSKKTLSPQKIHALKVQAEKAADRSNARHPTMAERVDAAARMAEALEAQDGLKRVAPEEFVGKTRSFAGAALPTKAKKVAAPKAEKEPRVTVTSVAEDLIRAGKTDEEVLETLSKQFPDFDAAKKRHYPSWYRARLVRSGQITKEFADSHRHAAEK